MPFGTKLFTSWTIVFLFNHPERVTEKKKKNYCEIHSKTFTMLQQAHTQIHAHTLIHRTASYTQIILYILIHRTPSHTYTNTHKQSVYV